MESYGLVPGMGRPECEWDFGGCGGGAFRWTLSTQLRERGREREIRLFFGVWKCVYCVVLKWFCGREFVKWLYGDLDTLWLLI